MSKLAHVLCTSFRLQCILTFADYPFLAPKPRIKARILHRAPSHTHITLGDLAYVTRTTGISAHLNDLISVFNNNAESICYIT